MMGSLESVFRKDSRSREALFGFVSSEVFLAGNVDVGPVARSDADIAAGADAFDDKIGFEMNLNAAATQGDIFVTATGNVDVITLDHMREMKDLAIICNSKSLTLSPTDIGISANTLPADTLCNPLILISLTYQDSSSPLIISPEKNNIKKQHSKCLIQK